MGDKIFFMALNELWSSCMVHKIQIITLWTFSNCSNPSAPSYGKKIQLNNKSIQLKVPMTRLLGRVDDHIKFFLNLKLGWGQGTWKTTRTSRQRARAPRPWNRVRAWRKLKTHDSRLDTRLDEVSKNRFCHPQFLNFHQRQPQSKLIMVNASSISTTHVVRVSRRDTRRAHLLFDELNSKISLNWV